MKEVVRFLITPKEKQSLEAEAQKLGLSMSAFLRLLIKNWNDGITFEKEPPNKAEGK